MEKLCEDMQVVVLMGGIGSRLSQYAEGRPKSLVDICGKPFFYYQLELMINAGFHKFVFCVEHEAKQIEDQFGNGKQMGISITYSYDGHNLLGTGGAVRKALPLLEDNFLLIYGDSFMDINYFELVVKYYSEDKKALMTILKNNNKYDTSNVEYWNDHIVRYNKKNRSITMNYIDYGISIFNKKVFESYEEDKPFDLSEVYSSLIANGQLASHIVYNRFYEIGTPPALEEFREYAKSRWFTPHKAIFLDRDGVINQPVWNEDIEQIDSPFNKTQIKWTLNMIEGLKKLQKLGYLLFIVTNQPAAAKGKTTYLQLCNVNNFIIQQLKDFGINITNYELCPHYPTININTKEKYLIKKCSCRKPAPGMLLNIINKYNIDTENSWMIGDAYSDIQCGQAINLHTAFLGTYKCDTCYLLGYKKPELICRNLDEFADKIGELNGVR